MNPTERMYGESPGDLENLEGDWGSSYGEYEIGAYPGTFPAARDLEYRMARPPREESPGGHVWHGGVLGWLGSGLRAGASWIGDQLQGWGAFLGGKLKGTSKDLGRAMRGRGERVGSAMEQRGERLGRGGHGPERRYGNRTSYRRPDEHVLDDVYRRISLSGLDAREIEVEVNNAVVTLSGRVPRRIDKRLIEDIVEQVFGVDEVRNHLRLARAMEDSSARRDMPGAAGAPEVRGENLAGNGHGQQG